MKRFTEGQRKWALKVLNKISQLKQDNAGLRQNYDTILAQKVNLAECLAQAQRDRDALRANRDDWMSQARELRDTLHAVRVESTKLSQRLNDQGEEIHRLNDDPGKEAALAQQSDFIGGMQAECAKLRAANASLTSMNDALAAGMQAAANRRYQQQRILDEDETLIAGLTALFDRMQARAIKAENDSKTLEPG